MVRHVARGGAGGEEMTESYLEVRDYRPRSRQSAVTTLCVRDCLPMLLGSFWSVYKPLSLSSNISLSLSGGTRPVTLFISGLGHCRCHQRSAQSRARMGGMHRICPPAEGRRRNPWTELGRRQTGADFFIMLKAPSLASLSTEAASCEERRDECGPRQERNSTRDCAAAPTAASLV